jgi:GTPase SAR1 family protein
LSSILLGVGKSSILLRFIAKKFQDNPDPTLGANFMAKYFDFNGS